jgi:hypothetical protein
VINLFPHPIPAPTPLLGLAAWPLRGLTAGVVAERRRREVETARQAHERAVSCWSFDRQHQMWIPDLLRP